MTDAHTISESDIQVDTLQRSPRNALWVYPDTPNPAPENTTVAAYTFGPFNRPKFDITGLSYDDAPVRVADVIFKSTKAEILWPTPGPTFPAIEESDRQKVERNLVPQTYATGLGSNEANPSPSKTIGWLFPVVGAL